MVNKMSVQKQLILYSKCQHIKKQACVTCEYSGLTLRLTNMQPSSKQRGSIPCQDTVLFNDDVWLTDPTAILYRISNDKLRGHEQNAEVLEWVWYANKVLTKVLKQPGKSDIQLLCRLDEIELYLMMRGPGRLLLVGYDITLADIAVYCVLHESKFHSYLKSYPFLRRWFVSISLRDPVLNHLGPVEEAIKMEYVAYLRHYETLNRCEFVINSGCLLDAPNKTSNICISALDTCTVQELCKQLQTALPEVSAFCKYPSMLVLRREMLKDVVCNSTQLDLFLHVGKEMIPVRVNAPLFKSLHLPRHAYAGYFLAPQRVCMQFGDFNPQEQCRFFWFRTHPKTCEWEFVGVGNACSLSRRDVGVRIKMLAMPVSTAGRRGPLCVTHLHGKVEELNSSPTFAYYIFRHEFTNYRLTGRIFRFVTYNTLSKMYTTNDSYSYCPSSALQIDYRLRLVIDELGGYNSDIICMQELDQCSYKKVLMPMMTDRGFGSEYYMKGFDQPEGLACFFNLDRFKQIHSRKLTYRQILTSKKRSLTTDHLFTEIRTVLLHSKSIMQNFEEQKTSLLIVVLELKSCKHTLIIGNTHLRYEPDDDHIRLLQAHMAVYALLNVQKEMKKLGYDKSSILLCGDLSSNPSSPAVQYLLNGELCENHKVFEKFTQPLPKMSHNISFVSACGKPPYTKYTKSVRECSDYIFIERSAFKVKQVVPLPERAELEQYEGIPNEKFPSNHMALVADLQI